MVEYIIRDGMRRLHAMVVGPAPCHTLVLPLDEVKRRYRSYYETMERKSVGGHLTREERLNVRVMRRLVSNEDFVREMKVLGHETLDHDTRSDHAMLKIYVHSAHGPHDFTLAKNREALLDMEEQMKAFYEDEVANYRDPRYVLATGILEGSYYAVFSQRLKKWVRCISGGDAPVIKPASMVYVTLLDYATGEVVNGNRIRPLFPGFCKLPAQGYSCSLGDVSVPDPIAGALSMELCSEFKKRVVGKHFYIHVVGYKGARLDQEGRCIPPEVIGYLISPDGKAICLSNEGGNRKLVEIEDNCVFK